MKQEHSALQAEIDELKKLVPGPDQDKTYSAITAKVQLQTRTEALEMQRGGEECEHGLDIFR